MSEIEYLQSIIIEAQEALDHAAAGGDREYAFDLWKHAGELATCFNTLYKFNSNIQDELS